MLVEWQSVAPQRAAFLPVCFSQYSNHDDSPVEGLDHLEVPLAFLTYVIEQLWFIPCNLNSTAELYTLEWFRCSGTSPHPDYEQQECQFLKFEQKPHKLQQFYQKQIDKSLIFR